MKTTLAASHRTHSRVGLEAHRRPGGTHRQRGTRADVERAAIEESMAIDPLELDLIDDEWDREETYFEMLEQELIEEEMTRLDILEQDLIFEEMLEDTYRTGD